MNRMSQKEVAESYARKGIEVFPCTKQKRPITKNGFKDASSDLSVVSSWWTDHPEALIGSPNSQNFTVVDVDDYDIPSDCKMVVDAVVDKLKEHGVVTDNTMKVTTMSGGTHFYFKKHSAAKRKIHALPQIDILGDGGYVILPDQKNYVSNSQNPWESIACLDELDMDSVDFISVDFTETTKFITKRVKEFRKTLKDALDAEKTSDESKKSWEQESGESDRETFLRVKKEYENSNKSIGYVDIENDRIHFDIKEGIYEKTTETYERTDPTEELLENGTFKCGVGELNSEILRKLFYNQEVQIKLAKSMGLKIPSIGTTKGVSMRSILPGHDDSKPSMGVRWSMDKSHIIVRDFSNHYNDSYDQTDYNLVRLYATISYKTNAPRLNSPEFTMWFMKMMWESGILNVDELKETFIKPIEKLTKNQKAMAEGIQTLDALKKLHENYDGTHVFANKFASAWTGIPVGGVSRVKKALEDRNIIHAIGMYDCCPERKDGFFKTKLLKITKPVSQTPEETSKQKLKGVNMKLNEAVNVGGKVEIHQDKEEQDIQSKYPELSTYIGFRISPQYHEKMKNFAEDFDIPNLVSADVMMIPVYISQDYKDLDDIDFSPDTTYFADQFELEVMEGSFGNNMLVAFAHSPSIQGLIDNIKEKHEYDIENPQVYFVVSSDIGDTDMTDIEFLETKFNEYVGYVGTNDLVRRFAPDDQITQLIDGFEMREQD